MSLSPHEAYSPWEARQRRRTETEDLEWLRPKAVWSLDGYQSTVRLAVTKVILDIFSFVELDF
jgi:hypothetical protein